MPHDDSSYDIFTIYKLLKNIYAYPLDVPKYLISKSGVPIPTPTFPGNLGINTFSFPFHDHCKYCFLFNTHAELQVVNLEHRWQHCHGQDNCRRPSIARACSSHYALRYKATSLMPLRSCCLSNYAIDAKCQYNEADSCIPSS